MKRNRNKRGSINRKGILSAQKKNTDILRRKKFQRKDSSWSSFIQKNLNDYTYVPSEETIAKLKYYYGPYNQVKGFRKFMDLPKSATANDLKDSKELWENLSLYILNDNEGTIRRLPFRLEQYNQVAFGPTEWVISERSHTPNFDAKRLVKSPKKISSKIINIEQTGRRNSNTSPRMMASLLITNFDKIKDYNNYLSPTSRRSK